MSSNRKRGSHFRPSVADCNRYSLDQTWAKIHDATTEFRICKNEIDQCLTVSEEVIDRKRGVSLENFVKGSENQLWTINEKKGQLENIYSGFCLPSTSLFIWGLQVGPCPKNLADKVARNSWSFVPLNNCVY